MFPEDTTGSTDIQYRCPNGKITQPVANYGMTRPAIRFFKVALIQTRIHAENSPKTNSSHCPLQSQDSKQCIFGTDLNVYIIQGIPGSQPMLNYHPKRNRDEILDGRNR